MEQEKKGLTAEEKEKQIFDTIESVEGKPLTEEEEWKILSGQGIEYISEGYSLIVPPIKIKQIEYLHKIEKLHNDKTIPDTEKFNVILESVSELVKKPKDELAEHFYVSDLINIINLLTFSFLHGKKMYQKKTVKKSELKSLEMKALY